MRPRGPLDLVYRLGALGWPVGYFAFGGFANRTGATVIGVGSFLVLGSLAVELVLRGRDRWRPRQAGPSDPPVE